MSDRGLIFNIQRFSLHDGPGIRTVVFFKGCPLHCQWCQNPEGIGVNRNLFRYRDRCIGCMACQDACSGGAISITDSGPLIDRAKCRLCLECVTVCPAGALEAAGREVSVSELAEEVLKDRIIFEESGGGVTISGGEPLLQPAFLVALLKTLKEQGIHTAIETSGCAPCQALEEAVLWADLILYDLKLVDAGKSSYYTGGTNALILGNLKALVGKGRRIRVRMPLIPTINDDRDSLQQAAFFLREIGIDELELIPYHNLGTAKYTGLDLEYKLPNLRELSPGQIAAVKSTLNEYGITVKSEV